MSYDRGGESASFRDTLLESARPELYRRNAFRVLGLPVRTTEREVRKYFREMTLRREFGGTEATGAEGGGAAPLPLTPSPDAEAIAEAQARLARLDRRFIDEFFWFWSPAGAPGAGEALTALSKTDIEAASKILVQQTEQEDERGRAAHDMAVMFHTAALDIEWAANQDIPISDVMKCQRDNYWQNAIALWRLALVREHVWSLLAARVSEVDDPRVTPAMTQELRQTLPVFLLTINSRLAAQASLRGSKSEVLRHVELMRTFNFDEAHVAESRQLVVEPLRQRVYDMCQTLRRESASEPERIERAVQRLLKESRSLLIAVHDLLPERDSRGSDARDAVAASANDAAIVKYKLLSPGARREWELAQQFFKRLHVIAASTSIRNIIEKNIAWASSHLPQREAAAAPVTERAQSTGVPRSKPRPTCWFCERSEAQESFPEAVRLYKKDPTRNVYYYEDVWVPRCAGCYAIQSKARRMGNLGAAAGGSVGVAACAGLLAALWQQVVAFMGGSDAFWRAVLLLAAVITLIAALSGLGRQLVYRKIWPQLSGGSKSLEHRLNFPRVRKMAQEGWSHIKPNS
jgi:hypothetical protein